MMHILNKLNERIFESEEKNIKEKNLKNEKQ